jgi:hypothetical protein
VTCPLFPEIKNSVKLEMTMHKKREQEYSNKLTRLGIFLRETYNFDL